MPVEKGEEMEKRSWSKNRGRPCRDTSNKQVPDCQALALPAKEPVDRNLQSPEMPRSQIPETVQHPRTPAPWSRQRTSRLKQEPAAGDGRASSLPTSTNLSNQAETAAAMAVGGGGGGDHQNLQAESIMPAQKKAKPLILKEPNSAQAAEVLKNFLSHFLTYLHNCPDRPYFRNSRQQLPGSSYEYEKFLHPGEFEVLLSIPVPDYVQYTEVEGYGGLFYTLTLLRKSRSFPAALLLEDGKTISPRHIMEEFWKHIDQFLQVFYSGWQMRLEKRKPNCPEVSLVMLDNQGARFMSVNLVPALEIIGQWPCMKKAKELLEEKKLLHLMRVFYFVAKQSPGRHNKETWRISFCHVEKEILNRHSSPQACYQYHRTECCRKDCLKMLEDLVDALKMQYPQMLAHLTSYHPRTSFLHTLWEWKTDQDWKPSEVTQCFERVLANFIHEVATAHLAHFFLPKCNLFGAKFFPPTKLKFLWAQLKEKEGTLKTFTVSRKRGCSALIVNPDMTWPLMITLGLIVLVSAVLPPNGNLRI
ncbi:cyclic GMP-AMP synthase-like isoform X2 [Rhineura floridana]|uniref:cyclic GMP-AMP synthase-like isoform X2 n=1 Tax=Rhineura floridana TaxID=261503 RepID=UPI002AC88755|nr:cyclic GMP-AMP synthase-like isoform X2 [Rhineura floridana]